MAVLVKIANRRGLAELSVSWEKPSWEFVWGFVHVQRFTVQSGYAISDTLVLIQHVSCSRLRKNSNHSFKNSMPLVGYARQAII